MPASPAAPSTRITGRALTILGAAAIAWAIAVWITGGTSVTLGGVRISSRNGSRAALVAMACWALLAWRMSAAERRAWVIAAADRTNRAAPWAAAILAIGVTALSAIFGIHVAGGSDSSGYVSQSRLWGEGQPRMPIDDIAGVDWPMRGQLVSPLGYAPTATVDTIGPTYSPGLPWLMALGAAVAGEPGRYLWTPLFAGLLVWGTFLFARGHGPPAIALAAAVLVASSQPILEEAIQTMSDLPGAALWLLCLLCLSGAGMPAALAGGVFGGLALAVRPNLVLVAVAVWGAWLVADTRPLAARLTRGVAAAVPVVMAAVAVALVNAHLWGSPLRSGYGDSASLFSRENVPENLAHLWGWMMDIGGYWCLWGLAALSWLAWTTRRVTWIAGLAVVAAVLASYLPYAVFPDWWYLRFYLPAWPLLAAAATVGAWTALTRWSAPGALLVVLIGALLIGGRAADDARGRRIFDLWRGEHRYEAVATYVRDHTRADAVVLSVQHSGAVNYYARRTVGRYDWIATADLDRLCDRWAAAGRQVLLVTDDWEESGFRQRFAGQVRGRLDWAPFAEARVGPSRVHVYDLATPTRGLGPEMIPVAGPAPWPWTRQRRTSQAMPAK